MAEKTPPGPTTSGRVAGVIAVIALVLGGYYAVVARAPSPTAEAPAGADAPAGTAEAEKPAAATAETATETQAPAKETAEAAPAPASGGEQAAAPATSAPANEAAKAGEGSGEGSAAGEQAAAPAAGTAEQSATESAAKAPGAAEPPAAAAAEAEASAAPSFDVVRVEPTGEAVVAGLAEPKATVEVLDGPAPIAKGEANERGEWAVVVEKPLAPGTHDLSIRTTSPDGKTQSLSEQRVAVEVPQPDKGQALVVLNEPNAPSRVLQMPEEPKAEVAANAPAAPAEPQAAVTAPAEPQASAPAPAAAAPADAQVAAETGAAPAGEQQVAAGETKPQGVAEEGAATEGAAPEGAASEGAAPEGAAAEGSAPATASASPDASAPKAADMAAAPAAESEPPAAAAAPAAQETQTAAAPAAPAASAEGAAPTEVAAAPVVEPKVTVDAVEFENGTIYIAGSSATGGTIRIYVDGVPVGDVAADANGRWLLETKHEMQPGQHTVRADQIEKATGNVVQRAEVPFEQQVDVAVLAPVTASGGSSAGAAGEGSVPGPQNVIIRRGDNLWTISRRLYGRGIRYSTIYEANADQIRNPHWIYPGQIFVLPAGDARWTN